MRTLHSEIVINASAETIWKILMDFSTYPEWNPFIKKISGKATTGEKIKVFIQPANQNGMGFSPIVLKSDPNTEFRWLGHLLVKGIFDGEHIFQLEKINSSKTKFSQSENFAGILVPLLWKSLSVNTIAGFNLMNEKLKERAESR